MKAAKQEILDLLKFINSEWSYITILNQERLHWEAKIMRPSSGFKWVIKGDLKKLKFALERFIKYEKIKILLTSQDNSLIM
jgi:hypothetical protein